MDAGSLCWRPRPYSGRDHDTVFILFQSSDDDNDEKKKETQNRKALVALYDMPGIQWTYSIPGPPHRGHISHITPPNLSIVWGF